MAYYKYSKVSADDFPESLEGPEAAAKIQHWWRKAKHKLGREETAHGLLNDWKSQTLRYLHHPHSYVQDPAQFQSIVAEMFLATVVISLLTTLIFHPEIFLDNPIKRLLGYNNICVAFDKPPARYLAAIGWTFIVSITWSYVKCEAKRLLLTRNKRKKVQQHPTWLYSTIILSHVLFGVSTSVFILCFVISPFEDLPGHTRPFAVYMVLKGFSVVAFAVDRIAGRGDLHFLDYVHPACVKAVSLNMALSILLPLNFELNIWYKRTHPQETEPLTPWYISCALDWMWMVGQIALGHFLPRPRLIVGRKVIHASTLETVRKLFIYRDKRSWFSYIKSKFEGASISPADKLHKESALTQRQQSLIEELVEIFGEMGREKISEEINWNHGGTVATMRATFEIDDRVALLNPWHRTGFFNKPGVYDAMVRINVTEHGAVRFSTRVFVPHSMEILDDCDPISAKPGYHPVDLLMAEEFKQFFTPSAGVLKTALAVIRAPSVSAVIGGLWSLLLTGRGIRNSKKPLDNTKGIFGKNYYAGLPFKIGEGAAKFGLQACQRDALRGAAVAGRPHTSMTGMEADVTQKYAANFHSQKTRIASPKWDFVVQVAKHHPSHQIDVGDVQWNEDVSPYVAVGSLTLRTASTDDYAGSVQSLKFNPWNQLKAHQPLGHLNLARKDVYRVHQEARLRNRGHHECPCAPGSSILGSSQFPTSIEFDGIRPSPVRMISPS